MRSARALLTGFAILTLLSAGCGSDETTARNMQQIYAEEGVPVRTAVLAFSEFRTEYTCTATLTGIRESSAHATIDDRVAAVHAKVGDRVAKDAVIVSFPTDNPAARYYQAKTAYENARKSHERIENLYAGGGVSKQARDNSRAAFEVAAANWDDVRQAVEVKAPISGVITKLDVQESDNVRSEDELFTIAQLDTLRAKVWVAEKDIGDFTVGLPAVATWNGRVVTGHVVQVDMSINRDRQAFGVIIEFENRGVISNTGVTADVAVATYDNPQCLVVDRKDIQTGDKGASVFVVDGGIAWTRSVNTGRIQGTDVEITGGLAPGDTLITESQMLLEDGMKVKIISDAPPVDVPAVQGS